MGPVQSHRLAIDLGTCHTVAVVRRGHEAPRPLLFDGSPLMPSGIYADESGQLSVGRDAERLSQLSPSRFEPYPKRRVDEGAVLLGDREVTVVDMLAALLKRVVAEATQSGVNPVGATVLTCPADWGAQRRNVLLAAARAANLGPVDLVDEPIAAATYLVRVLGQTIEPLQSLAVFDFGGGTLDVSVVRQDLTGGGPSGLRVLAVGGLDDLGGVDVDAALVGHLGQLIELRAPDVWRRLADPDSTGAQRDRRALWSEVRQAKEMLSRTASAPVHVPGTEHALHLTRDELERVAGALIDRAVDETRRVLERAGVGTNQLAGILLVGGSSRIPLVASRLHTRFGIAPTVPEQPELPVAYGALVAALGGGAATGAAGAGRVPGGYPSAPVSGQPPASPVSASMPFAPYSPAPAGASPMSAPPMSGSPVSPPPLGSPPPYNSPPPPGMPPPGFPPPGVSGMGTPPPPYTPAPTRRERRGRKPWKRYVASVVVLGLLALCGWGGRAAYRAVSGSVRDTFNSATNPGSDPIPDGDKIGGLAEVAKVDAPEGGAVTAVVDGESVYYAVSTPAGTIVAVLNNGDGKEKWKVTVAAEPEEVKLTRTGSLLLVDGDNATTHEGKDIRAVLEAGTGAQKALYLRANQRDVAYLGNDAIIEVDDPKDSVQRIDLTTGKARWTRDGGFRSIITPGNEWSGPLLTFAANGRPEGHGTRALLPWPKEDDDAANFDQPISVDPNVMVALNEDTGKGSLLNLANGQPTLSADLPLDYEHWVAYAGAVVGKLNDKTAPGRVVIAGFAADKFTKRWEHPLPAGAAIERIKPCGPTQVCVGYRDNSSKWHTIALDVTDGAKEKWRKTADFGDEPDWYMVGNEVLHGNWSFGSIGGDGPAMLDPATGTERLKLANGNTGAFVVAASGNRVLVRGVGVNGGDTRWTAVVADVTTQKVTDAVAVSAGTDQLASTRLVGDLVVVVNGERQVRLMRIPREGS